MKIPKARKLKNGKYFIQLRLKQPDGSTLSIPITEETEKLCTARAAEIKAGIKKPANKATPLTLGEACDAYIAAGDLLSPSTIAGYERIRRNLFQGIMNRKLSALTNDMINADIARMVKEGKSWKYISNGIALIRPVLKSYFKDFELDIKKPKNQKTRSKQKAQAKKYALPTDAEIQAILIACQGQEIELPVLLAVWLGMRMSEIRGLRFSDIDRAGKMIHVQTAIVDDKHGRPAEKDTKSDAGDRWIELPNYILSIIPTGDPDEHIVKLSGQAIYKRYSRMLESAGIRHFRFHDLRCANAAAMIRIGIDSKYAMEHNCWATENLYKQVYGYIMADKMATESIKIDQYFMPKIRNAKKIANKK